MKHNYTPNITLEMPHVVGVGVGESSRGIVVQHGSKMTVQSFPLTFGLNFGSNSGFQFLPVD